MANAPKQFGSSNRTKRPRQDKQRPPAHERGYDWDWYKLRNAYAAEFPLCEHCYKNGITKPMDEVDHIKPFDGPDDPLRLARFNLQSLCRSCHATKTAKDGR